MRDVLITLLVVVGCVWTLKKPYLGILLWSWISYMNPHRLSWGFAYDFPFAQMVALSLFVAIPFSKSMQKPPINALTLVWFAFIVFMAITTFFAYFPEEAFLQYKKILKIQVMVLLTLVLITNIDKLRQLIWVIVLSMGYFSIKGGFFTLLTGGSQRVWGPNGSFIEGNNELAVATLMIIPLMAYLYSVQSDWRVKYGLLAGMGFSFIAAMGSQSRGAFIAFAAVGLFFWLKSKQKLLGGMIMVVLGVGIIAFMPESWHERMDTIQDYEQDGSAMGRINAWYYAINAANSNLLGVGFDSWSPETFILYAPNPYDVHAAHSIYFSVLADHGWLGLMLFLLIFYGTWKKLAKVIKTTHQQPAYQEINVLARMIQVSLIAYWVGGAFLSLSYFDLPWHLVSFGLIVEKVLAEKMARTQA